MDLYRNINKYLHNWINNKDANKPLIVDGARQVGKTTTILNFLKNNNIDCIYIDIKAEPIWIDTFKKLNAKLILDEIQFKFNKDLKNPNIVIFIDEIQQYMPILELLKYFNQDYKELKVIVSGSLFGTKYNDFNFMYPVGKVYTINMYPMTFEEFMVNVNNKLHNYLIQLTKDFNKNNVLINNHNSLLYNYYLTFLTTGGMPEVVVNYINNKDDKLTNYNQIQAIKNNIYKGYLKNLEQNFTKIENDKATRIYNIIDNQLNKENKRFILADIDTKENKSKPKMQRYKTTFLKLNSTHIVNELNYINSLNQPLKMNLVESNFKLYYNDVGFYSLKNNLIVTSMVNENQNWIKTKGGIFENFANNEIKYNINKLLSTYCYKSHQENKELDFVLEYQYNKTFVFEIKSSHNITSKSFDSIAKQNKYICIKCSTKDFFIDKYYYNIPIYFIGYLVRYCLDKFDEK